MKTTTSILRLSNLEILRQCAPVMLRGANCFWLQFLVRNFWATKVWWPNALDAAIWSLSGQNRPKLTATRSCQVTTLSLSVTGEGDLIWTTNSDCVHSPVSYEFSSDDSRCTRICVKLIYFGPLNLTAPQFSNASKFSPDTLPIKCELFVLRLEFKMKMSFCRWFIIESS